VHKYSLADSDVGANSNYNYMDYPISYKQNSPTLHYRKVTDDCTKSNVFFTPQRRTH